MKQWLKTHSILLVLLALGIAGAIGILSGRIYQEETNKNYDIILDYSSLQEMVEVSDRSMDDWLEFFRGLGLDKLAILDTTILNLTYRSDGKVYLDSTENIRSQYGWQDRYPDAVSEWILSAQKAADMLAVCTDPELAEWIESNLSQRYEGKIQVLRDESGTSFFCLTGPGDITGDKISQLSLGTLPEYIALAERHGYTLIPRSLPVEDVNGEYFLRDVIRDYEELNVPYFIGGGNAMTGNDDHEASKKLLLDYLANNDATLGVIETSQQSLNLELEGLSDVVFASDYNAVRVFSMWNYVQWRYKWYNYDGPEEITNCLYRAAYERNCHLIYLKMILDGEESSKYITDPEAYEAMVGDFISRMAANGYSMKTLSSAGNHSVSFPLLLLVAVGAIAAAMLVLGLIVPLSNKHTYILTALGCVCAAGVLYVMPNTGRLILSIGGGIALPLVAAIGLSVWLLHSDGHKADIFTGTIAAAVVALIGGLFAAAPLSDSSYMLEMQLYRGVKIMQLLPLAVFVLYYLKISLWDKYYALSAIPAEDRKSHRKAVTHTFLELPVKIRTLVILGAGILVLAGVALAGSYYLARTGHSEGAEAATLELLFRNFLEYYLPARPRTKEFLIGYPCLMLFIWARRKNIPLLPLFLGLGSVIGLTSIVNTFLHIRTTFMMSLIRTGIGLIFGLVVGAICVAVAELLYRQIKKRIPNV